MDCGLENGDKVKSFPILGKRGSAQLVGEEDAEKYVKRGVKRGKLQDDNLLNFAAGVLDHPCRSQ